MRTINIVIIAGLFAIPALCWAMFNMCQFFGLGNGAHLMTIATAIVLIVLWVVNMIHYGERETQAGRLVK